MTTAAYSGDGPLRDREDLYAAGDDLLVGLSSATPTFDMVLCRRLPPWRAVMFARVAHRCRLIDRRTLDELVREAALIGGDGELRPHRS